MPSRGGDVASINENGAGAGIIRRWHMRRDDWALLSREGVALGEGVLRMNVGGWRARARGRGLAGHRV